MHTLKFAMLKMKVGEPVEITYDVVDKNNMPVTVEGGTAFFRIGDPKNLDTPAYLQKTELDGVTLDGTQAIVEFLTSDIKDANDAQVTGTLFAQLTINLAGEPLVVAEGPIQLEKVIPAPAP